MDAGNYTERSPLHVVTPRLDHLRHPAGMTQG
jgi:hypothetical protein